MAYIKSITIKKSHTEENGNVFFDVKFGSKVIGMAAYIDEKKLVRFKARDGIDIEPFEFVAHWGFRCDYSEIKQRIIEQAITKVIG